MSNNWFQIIGLFSAGLIVGSLINLQNAYKRILRNIEDEVLKSLEPRSLILTVGSDDRDIIGHLMNYTRKPTSSVSLLIPRPINLEPGETVFLPLELKCEVPKIMGCVIHLHPRLQPLMIPNGQVVCVPGKHDHVTVPINNPSTRPVHFKMGTIGFHLYAGDFGMFNVQVRN